MLRRSLLLAMPFLTTRAQAQKPTRLVFGTDWLAEAEHGGFYQALAMGLYARRGLDVQIRMGGPQTNGMAAITSGQVDLMLSSGSFASLAMVQQAIPVTAIAAYFQKDPQCLMAHPGQGLDSLAALKSSRIMISAGAREGYWQFLKARFGYSDSQIRPYNYSLAPFLADKGLVQQGFISSEPYAVAREAGFQPVVMLLADAGFDNYSDVILVRDETLARQPDALQSFVEASTEGWYHYLYHNPEPANALIRKANPDMTQGLLDFAIAAMRRSGIVDSGDSLTLGIGAMTLARWQGFYNVMASAKIFPAGLDVAKAFTTRFVNQGYGLSLRPS